MTIEHQISPTWTKHIAEVRAQMARIFQQIAIHKASLWELEQEHGHMVKHLGVLVDQISKAEGLPVPTTPYRLSDDGTRIVGDVPGAPGKE